jgi:hypothetical protein
MEEEEEEEEGGPPRPPALNDEELLADNFMDFLNPADLFRTSSQEGADILADLAGQGDPEPFGTAL